MVLELQEGQVFQIVSLVYRTGLLDKASPLVGEAMKSAMEEAEFNVGNLVEVFNESTDATVIRLNKMLKYAGPALSLMGNERIMGPVMRSLSRLLDFSVAHTAFTWLMHKAVKATLEFFKKVNAGKLTALGVS